MRRSCCMTPRRTECPLQPLERGYAKTIREEDLLITTFRSFVVRFFWKIYTIL